jgi:hypothetical protein
MGRTKELFEETRIEVYYNEHLGMLIGTLNIENESATLASYI